jgi:SAM-dependent methyltransferase
MKKEFKFYNTESAKAFLVQGSSDYLGDMEHLSSLWDAWGDLNEAVAKGEPVKYEDLSEKDDEWIEAYISSNHWKACIEANEIINSINLRNVTKVLDLGGGTGKYAVEFVKAKSDIQAVVVDYPNVIEHTKDYIAKSGLSDKITTMSGDYLNLDSYGNDFDLVIISNIIQYNSIWTNVKMLQRIYDSLKSGGQLVIHDQIISDDRTSPEKAALYALNMLVNTKDGNCYTETDIWIMMKEAWV